MKNIFLIHAFSLLLFACSNAVAQTVKLSAKCGDVLEGEFKNSTEHQDIEISMDAGASFEVTVIPIGDYLKVRMQLYDPGGQELPLSDEDVYGMFSDDEPNTLVVKSGTLSASGKYKIRLLNYWNTPANVGSYTAHIKCVEK